MVPGGRNPLSEHRGQRSDKGGRRGRGGDGTPHTNQASKDSGADGVNERMLRRPRTAVPPRPRDMGTDDNSVGPLPRQSDGADGARPKNGMHSRRKYGLLAPEEMEKGRSNTGPRARGDGHRATIGTAEEGQTEMPMDAKTSHRALLARGMQGEGKEV